MGGSVAAEAETRYAVTADGVYIAYQTRGNGADDLVFIPGFAWNYEVALEEPHFLRMVEAMAARWRVILFDKRGTGLSDRQNTPDLEMRADDLRAVLDATDSRSAVLVGQAEGAALAAFFAASYRNVSPHSWPWTGRRGSPGRLITPWAFRGKPSRLIPTGW